MDATAKEKRHFHVETLLVVRIFTQSRATCLVSPQRKSTISFMYVKGYVSTYGFVDALTTVHEHGEYLTTW